MCVCVCMCVCACICVCMSEWSIECEYACAPQKREEADAARAKFACNRSDHITLFRVFEAWQAARAHGKREEFDFLHDNFLSKTVMDTADDLCSEFYEALYDLDFLPLATSRRARGKNEWVLPDIYNENADNIRIIKGVICAGFYPNIIRCVAPDKRYTQIAEGAIPKVPDARDIQYFTEDDGRVFMHPTAVNFHTREYQSPWLVYLTKVQTSKVYIRDATMVSAYALLLFGGEIQVDRENGFIVIGKWIKFHADLKIAVLIKELRRELDKLMQGKINNPGTHMSTHGRCCLALGDLSFRPPARAKHMHSNSMWPCVR